MEKAVAFIAGINFLVLGLSYFFNPVDWIAWIAHLQKQERRGALSIGMINLLIGTFILGFHWEWHGVALILTLAGVIALIMGAIDILLPSLLPRILEWLEPYCTGLLLIAGILLIAVAGASFTEWWR